MTRTSINFMQWKFYALALSLALLLTGVWRIADRGVRLGVEFEGGTTAVVQFERAPQLGGVRRVLVRAFGPDVVLYGIGGAASNQVMVRLPAQVAGPDGDGSNATVVLDRALRDGGVGAFTVSGSEYIGPAVGDELRTRGISAMVLSLGGIMAYLTIRYRFAFALGAVVATVHDLAITAAFLALFDYDLTLNVVAALLTVAGYSSNDTIVVFDRVREEMRQRAEPMAQVINRAINQTLSRTIITAGVTLLAVIALFLFGGEVLRGFAFTLIVGIVSGTYSTVFIAGTVAAVSWRRAGRV